MTQSLFGIMQFKTYLFTYLYSESYFVKWANKESNLWFVCVCVYLFVCVLFAGGG